MAKIFVCVIAFAMMSTTVAVAAGSVTDVSPEMTVSHPHNYWLSDGLNRLVFWQAPLQTGRSVAQSRQGPKSPEARPVN